MFSDVVIIGTQCVALSDGRLCDEGELVGGHDLVEVWCEQREDLCGFYAASNVQ